MRRCRIESIGASHPRRRLFPWGSVKHAVAAGKRCLAASRHRRVEVELLVNAGVHRDRHICEPAMAVFIQHRLGINVEFQGRTTLSFDLGNGGCGMLNAAQVVTALMESGEITTAMVVASEVNRDRRPDPAYPYPASGAALLLDLSPRRAVGFESFAFGTNEDFSDLYTSAVSLAVPRGRIVFSRNAPELEEAYLALAGPVMEEALEKAKLRRDEIDLVVPAQISPGFLGRLPATIGVPGGKVADFSRFLPDTLTTSVVLALDHALQSGRCAPGTRSLLLAFGSGVTVGAAVYRF
jgi:3-oxoacyl-[acyl-carrier-protein] synthase-3